MAMSKKLGSLRIASLPYQAMTL